MLTLTSDLLGIRVCCCARDGARCAKGWPIWTGAIYVSARRSIDGVMTWRRAGSFGGTRSGKEPSERFLTELRAAAPYPWLDCRHGKAVTVDDIAGLIP